jgi:acyl-CoA thioester hydrolase
MRREGSLAPVFGGAMTERFERSFQAGWGDMDFNGHMRNTAYLDRSGDVRMMFFQAHGFPATEFARRKVGPVIQRDEVEYFREFSLLDPYRVTLTLGGMSADRSRFRIVNEFLREDGRRAARVTSTGGWLDLEARRLIVPPGPLADVLDLLERAEGFEELPGVIRDCAPRQSPR